MKLLLRWAASAAAVAAAVYLVEGIHLEGGAAAFFGVALILGLVNALVRPLLRTLACGLVVLTLGLFLLVINALMLLLVAWIAQSFGLQFQVDGFGPALVGSIIISLVSFVASLLFEASARSESAGGFAAARNEHTLARNPAGIRHFSRACG